MAVYLTEIPLKGEAIILVSQYFDNIFFFFFGQSAKSAKTSKTSNNMRTATQ